MLKHRINSLENRIHHLEHKLEKMEQISGVCFGGKKLFKKQFGDCYPDHETWRKAFHKRRYHGMTISGRRNSNDGNYVFRYELKTHNLFYTAMNREEVCIPNVVFPRGQEILDAYLIRQKTTHEAPIAWRIEDTGGSFLIKCVLHLPEPKYKNYSYDCGCIGMDTNLQFSL